MSQTISKLLSVYACLPEARRNTPALDSGIVLFKGDQVGIETGQFCVLQEQGHRASAYIDEKADR